MISNRPECTRADLDLISATGRCTRSCRKWKRVPSPPPCSVRLAGRERRATEKKEEEEEKKKKRQEESLGNTIRVCGMGTAVESSIDI